MKIIIDTNKNVCKVNTKNFDTLTKDKQNNTIQEIRNFLINNSNLSDYEEDCMWMSYRYCIGRHTIAAHMHANDIWMNCKNRMTKERQLFTAFDINREIEDKLRFNSNGPQWQFPMTSLNKIYTTAIDIFCNFIQEYNVKTKEDYLKYYQINVILTDNEKGYKYETITWEEKLQTLIPVFKELYNIETIKDIITLIKTLQKNNTDDIDSRIRWIIRYYPNIEYFYFHDIEDLFVWNDLVHCFDYEHHHKSILTDNTECEWFWTWTYNTEQHEDGYFYKGFGYKKIRVPINKWKGSITTWIPDEAIKENIY